MLRVELGLTQRQLAEKIGVKQPQLARLESGKILPQLDTLREIAEAVGYSVEINFVPKTMNNKEVTETLNRLFTQRYLVKYSSDWGDEIAIYGLDLLTDIDKEWFESLRPTNDHPLRQCVGTNEDIEYCSSEDFLSHYTWTPITEEEYELLKRLIGTDYGHFFYPQEDDEEIEEEEGWV